MAEWNAKYFTLAEMTRSATATRLGIDNTIPPSLIENMRKTAIWMDKVREELGTPIVITSGYRCQELNDKIGGSPNSAHTEALAADFVCLDGKGGHLSLRGVFDIMRKQAADKKYPLHFDQMILEHYNPDNFAEGWIHFAVPRFDKMSRREALIYDGKKYHKAGNYKWG